MAQNDLDVKNTAFYVNLVTFTWGDSSVQRYTSGVRSITDDSTGQAFAALPAMKIDFSTQNGGGEDKPITILMPPVHPIDKHLLGTAFAPVTVKVEEMDVRDQNTKRTLFLGFISKVLANKNGKADQSEVTVAGLKSLLRAPLGIPACNTCVWKFGDKNCKIPLGPLKIASTVSSVTGSLIVVAEASKAPPYFFRGYVTVDGLSLMVREHQSNQNLLLVEPAPVAWASQACILTPGCDKTTTDCNDKWNNIQNFGGFGIGIPKHHPIFETQ